MKLKNVFRSIKLIWEIDKKYLPIKILVVVVKNILVFLSLRIIEAIIDHITSNHPNLKIALLLVFINAIIEIVQLLISYFQKEYYPRIEMRLTYKVQKYILHTTANVDYHYFDDPKFYDAMENASKETTGLIKSFDSFLSIFSGLITLATAIIIFLEHDYLIPALIIVTTIPCFFIKLSIKRYSYDVSKETNSLGRKISAVRHMLTSKHYAHEIRSFDLFNFLMNKYKSFFEERFNLSISSNRKKNQFSIILSLISVVVTVITSIRLIILILGKIITIGQYTKLQSYTIKIQSSIGLLVDGILNIAEHNMYLENLFSFLDIVKNQNKEESGRNLNTNSPHKIEFRNVSFSYPNSDVKVLKNISFTINPSEKIMLIGENGAGKTTLLMLLNAFYFNYSGQILIDDIDIKDYKPSSIRSRISMMFQKGVLFPISLKENIVFDKSLTNDEYKRYPWFDSIVTKYPKGLDTILLTYMYPNGIQPSGGEAQRIQLMKALMKHNTGIFVMDEPSSALDPETEYQIFSSLNDILQGRTAILISHRLSYALAVDKIIHLRDGCIAEIGSHKDLMNNNGEYAKLFNMQAERYLNSTCTEESGSV